MSLTINVNYFNSFYLKRIYGDTAGPEEMPYAVDQGDRATGFSWQTPIIANTTYDWYIEESRIGGGYNNTTVDLGVKAYIVEDNDTQQRRGNSLIYSGIYNSRTGINQTNQFSVAESITRSVDPLGGTIQRLFAEDTNLTIFQERKVNVALIDKDAIYTAEGGAMTTTANVVIGQITPVPGNWGIGTNPESFATYGYTKYFIDKDRNAVLKIQGSQIQEISVAGMTDFFRDQLSLIGTNGALLGSYDVYNQNYVLSMQPDGRFLGGTYKTLTFDERNAGWTSFFTYQPDDMFSCRGNFYTAAVQSLAPQDYYLWRHYDSTTTDNRNNFYGTQTPSTIQFVFNPAPSQIKTFKTINYEGSSGWEVTNFISDSTGEDPTVTPTGSWLSSFDTAIQGQLANQYARIYSYDEGLYNENGINYRAGFDRKQNKYWAVIPNNTQDPIAGEVIWGNQTMGIKGYFTTVTMKTDTDTNNGGLKSLFAVSSEFIGK